MKPIKKKFAKLYIALLAVVLVLASVFCFIPMKWGNSYYNSFIGDLRFAGDIEGGYYAEYKIVKGNSQGKINSASAQIYKVLDSYGYTNANIYNVENNSLRIEVSAPNGGQTAEDTISLLRTIGVGLFEIKGSTDKDAIVLDGTTYVSGVSVKNYNGQIMVQIEFNDAGKTKFSEVVSSASTDLYIYLGSSSSPITISAEGITSYDSLPLTFKDAKSAEEFKTKVLLGSLPIALDSNFVEINTMTATYGNGTLIPNPNDATFLATPAKLAVLISLAVIILLGLVYMIVRFKVLGLLNLIAFLAEAIIMVFMLWAIPTIELSITGVLAIIAGFIIISVNTLVLFGAIERERKQGKTILASLETGIKKVLPVNLVSTIVIAVLGSIFAIFTTSAMHVVSLIMLISAVISMIANLALYPFLY